MSTTTKKELIERAFERMISKDEDQISLAVMDFRKANEMFPYNEASHRIIEYYAVMAEILLGIESSKQSLLRLIAQGLSVNGYEKVPLFTSRDKVSMNWGARDFLEDQVSKIWLKSLKYDAIIKALGDSESEIIKDQEKLAKLKSIIGEVKSSE